MAGAKGAGRPQKGAETLSRERILSRALPLVQKNGIEAISFRRLADVLVVSPMAIKYHVGNRHDLLAALIERAFQNTIEESDESDPARRLKHILSRYCARAIENAYLLRCILGDPTLMGGELVAITREIRKHTRILNDGDANDVMLDLLVDYTHGFVFSAFAAPRENGPTMEGYLRGIDWVLNADAAAQT
ncbi:MAG: hypothetical protein AAF414_24395 [Pseudomonadota bacterium]